MAQPIFSSEGFAKPGRDLGSKISRELRLFPFPWAHWRKAYCSDFLRTISAPTGWVQERSKTFFNNSICMGYNFHLGGPIYQGISMTLSAIPCPRMDKWMKLSLRRPHRIFSPTSILICILGSENSPIDRYALSEARALCFAIQRNCQGCQ